MSGAITQEQIEAFAAAWYQALDFHVPTDEITTLVADPDVEMIFPEKTLHGRRRFQGLVFRRNLHRRRADARRDQHLL